MTSGAGIPLRIETDDRRLIFRLLETTRVGEDEAYSPVDGVEIRLAPGRRSYMERKQWPPEPETVEFVLTILRDGALKAFSSHLFKAAGRTAKVWIAGRRVTDEPSALEVLRKAQGSSDDAS